MLNYNFSNKITLILEDDNEKLNYIHSIIQEKFNFIKNDLLLISENIDLIIYLTNGTNYSYTNFVNLLLLHTRSLKIYDQLRFINDSGNEIIRINYNGSNQDSYIEPNQYLQNTVNSNYFNNTMMLSKGKIFVSNIDLSVENNSFEIPYVPTVRFATPIIDSFGNKKGILIFNYLGEDIFNYFNLIKQNSKLNAFYLLNSDSYYIQSPNTSQEYGNMLKTNITFQRDNPTIWNNIQKDKNGSISKSNTIYQFYTFSVVDSLFFNYSGPNYWWIAVIFYNKAYISSLYSETQNSLFNVLLNYNILFVIVGALITYNVTKRHFKDIERRILEKKQNKINRFRKCYFYNNYPTD